MKSKSSKVTIKMIAEHCGVSACTVSSVLQNHYKSRRITMETVEKIYKATKELGYLPDISARRMRINNSSKMPLILALLTSYEAPLNLTNNFLQALREAVKNNEALNSRFEFSISIEMFPSGKLSEMKNIISGNCFNAAIITNTSSADDLFLKENILPFPAVLVDRKIDGYSSVVSTDALGREAAKMLKQKGRKLPAILCGTPLTQSTQMRIDSFKKEYGGKIQRISAVGLSEGSGYIALKQFFSCGGKLDSLYCISDSLAMGAYLALKENKLCVPKDVSVIGVGDYAYSEYFSPPLTVVGAKYGELSALASSMLLSIIENPQQPPHVAEVGERVSLRSSV